MIFDGNQSAIKLETNRRKSHGKIRCVEKRYFCIKDFVDKNIISAEYYATGKILAYYFTKPL